jgi:hypothetical protein
MNNERFRMIGSSNPRRQKAERLVPLMSIFSLGVPPIEVITTSHYKTV